MAIRHVKDFFDASTSPGHASFGFTGSLTPLPSNASDTPQRPDSAPTKGAKSRPEPVDEYAGGGSIHMHPHGHSVSRVEHRFDGAVEHHHAHGGFTVHHADGRIAHHHGDGSPVSGAVESHDDASEYAHGGHARDRAAHDDAAQDRTMINKILAEHEKQEGKGMRHGGVAITARLPRGMRPAAAQSHSPVNLAPRDPTKSRSAPNGMPGGVMAYGVQPGDEPDMSGGPSPGGMRRGGRAKRP